MCKVCRDIAYYKGKVSVYSETLISLVNSVTYYAFWYKTRLPLPLSIVGLHKTSLISNCVDLNDAIYMEYTHARTQESC